MKNSVYHFFTPVEYNNIPPTGSAEAPTNEEKPRKISTSLFFRGLVTGMCVMLACTSALSLGQRLYSRYYGQRLSMDDKIGEIKAVLDAHSINAYDDATLEESMYRGFVVGVGDPYTTYFDKKSLATFLQSTEGSYAGIGLQVTLDPDDKITTVTHVYPGEPADMAGIKAGDKFVKINGLDVTGASLDDVTGITKGKAGTTVRITVYRSQGNDMFEVDVVRKKINIPTVTSEMLTEDIAYIKLNAFDRVTTGQFEDAYTELMQDGAKGLIIDLRNNPGGLLDVVTKITDILIPEGIIVYTEDKNGEREYIYSNPDRINIPLAVLVNANSASASEVMSGAIKDTGTGVLVGEKTFGKGIVQNLFMLDDGSALKVTVARYYTPSGVCIQGDGIVPEYVVEMPTELAAQIGSLNPEDDPQLQKAIEVVKEMDKKQ
ncbi:MAG: S41 family peptidase [Clostridiales bacterium]|nr:S41 family peptidase [Clostridiales bacterium]